MLRPWYARMRTPSRLDRKSTRLNSSHSQTSYAAFCLNKERGGRRGRRFRDRRRRGGGGGRPEGGGGNNDTEVREDDVLLSVAGRLRVLEDYAFVRTSG